MKISVVGMVWYRPQTYDHLRASFVDGASLPATYDEWLRRALAGESEIATKGGKVARVDIDPVEFPAWCAKKGRPLNGASRADFANEKAASQNR